MKRLLAALALTSALLVGAVGYAPAQEYEGPITTPSSEPAGFHGSRCRTLQRNDSAKEFKFCVSVNRRNNELTGDETNWVEGVVRWCKFNWQCDVDAVRIRYVRVWMDPQPGGNYIFDRADPDVAWTVENKSEYDTGWAFGGCNLSPNGNPTLVADVELKVLWKGGTWGTYRFLESGNYVWDHYGTGCDV